MLSSIISTLTAPVYTARVVAADGELPDSVVISDDILLELYTTAGKTTNL